MRMLIPIFMMIVSLICCSKRNNNNNKIQDPFPLVKIKLISKEIAYDKLILVGQIHGENEVIIFPDISVYGIVRNKQVDEGMKVTMGSALMEIDQEAVTGNRYNRFVVRAKISGIISQVYVQEGDTVSSNTKLCQIVQMKKLKVVIDIPEREIGKIKEGQIVNISSQSYPGEIFSGKLSNIHPSVDPNTLTLRAEVIIDNTSNKLKPGMFAKIEIHLKEKKAILIPLNSIIIEDNVRYVYIYNPDPKKQTVSKRIIKTGDYYGKYIEVIDIPVAVGEKRIYGIEEGEYLVVDGHYQVIDNDKVRVINQK
ncbi:MAG: efflux RND transporter periplasmic adaptor subunit [Spirochaetota bacterium]|nr:efflux RND transporter periplasmic adaptor subunit [Spirochaetota bacterium]